LFHCYFYYLGCKICNLDNKCHINLQRGLKRRNKTASLWITTVVRTHSYTYAVRLKKTTQIYIFIHIMYILYVPDVILYTDTHTNIIYTQIYTWFTLECGRVDAFEMYTFYFVFPPPRCTATTTVACIFVDPLLPRIVSSLLIRLLLAFYDVW